MKSQDTRQQFIQLRAQGLSYRKIADQLDISRATCSSWERQLADEIATIKKDKLEELYLAYGMAKDKRISALGDAINKIDDAIEQADFTDADPIKLLELKLKYQDALNKEYIPTVSTAFNSDAYESSDILKELGNMVEQVKAGELTPDQTAQELRILSEALKAYNQSELEAKLEGLANII